MNNQFWLVFGKLGSEFIPVYLITKKNPGCIVKDRIGQIAPVTVTKSTEKKKLPQKSCLLVVARIYSTGQASMCRYSRHSSSVKVRVKRDLAMSANSSNDRA